MPTRRLLDDYFDRRQLADELKTTVRAVDRLRAIGRAPPSIKISNKLYFRREAVLVWLRAKENPGTFEGRRSRKVRAAVEATNAEHAAEAAHTT